MTSYEIDTVPPHNTVDRGVADASKGGAIAAHADALGTLLKWQLLEPVVLLS